jgi:hypothetical protein
MAMPASLTFSNCRPLSLSLIAFLPFQYMFHSAFFFVSNTQKICISLYQRVRLSLSAKSVSHSIVFSLQKNYPTVLSINLSSKRTKNLFMF